MKKHKGPMPESVKNFWRIVVKGDLSGDGEDVIDTWEEKVEETFETRDHNYLAGIYKLNEEDLDEIREIIVEYRAAREQEEAEREKRRLAEEEADAVMANHYAERIKKIVISKPNQFLPKTSKPKRSRGN